MCPIVKVGCFFRITIPAPPTAAERIDSLIANITNNSPNVIY